MKQNPVFLRKSGDARTAVDVQTATPALATEFTFLNVPSAETQPTSIASPRI